MTFAARYFKKGTSPLAVCWLVSAVCFGMFYELLSAAFSAVIAGILVFKIIKNGARLRLGLMPAAVLAVFLGYILTCFWAVDTGAALIGIIKFLPLPLFMLAAEQEERDTLEDILNLIPPLAVFMTVISAVLMHIPVLSGYFSVAGRLSGFFQYPNTYALFALIGVILLLSDGKFDIARFIMLLLLAGGIVYSGSRTVAVMTVFFVAVMLIRSGSRGLKIIIPLSIGAILAAAAVYALISGNFGSVGRFLKLSLNESTFIGRIIYFKDGLRLILKNPFGLGYLGFYYTEQFNQTAVYSVRYIHNELLQLLLDIGWLPAAFFAAVLIAALFSRKINFERKMIILAVCAHAMMDFDLQFVSIFILLCMAADSGGGKIYELSSRALSVPFALLIPLCSYFGAVFLLYGIHNYTAANRLFPLYTEAKIALLTNAEETGELDTIADGILSRNKYVSVAYSAKAKAAYSKGDFKNVIEYKEQAIKYAPYQISEYNEYCYMLIVGIRLYNKSGDSYSAEYCKNKLLDIPLSLKEVKEKTDPLAYKIKDKPELELSKDITDLIASIGGVKK